MEIVGVVVVRCGVVRGVVGMVESEGVDGVWCC